MLSVIIFAAFFIGISASATGSNQREESFLMNTAKKNSPVVLLPNKEQSSSDDKLYKTLNQMPHALMMLGMPRLSCPYFDFINPRINPRQNKCGFLGPENLPSMRFSELVMLLPNFPSWPPLG